MARANYTSSSWTCVQVNWKDSERRESFTSEYMADSPGAERFFPPKKVN
jgi:hypothetical protein